MNVIRSPSVGGRREGYDGRGVNSRLQNEPNFCRARQPSVALAKINTDPQDATCPPETSPVSRRGVPNSGKCLHDQELFLFDVSQTGSLFCLEAVELQMLFSFIIRPQGPWFPLEAMTIE